MNKILVTGYNGFIGYNLVQELLKKYQVIGISNKQESKQNIIHIKKDVRKLTEQELPRDISHIVHLAALTDVSFCQENPSECIDINVRGTQNMLEIARKIQAKFLYLSTSHVYGIPVKLPIKENHPRNPLSIYASSKLAGEIISQSYARSYDMNLSIVRLFSIYGPHSPPYLVTSKIIHQLMKGNEIKLGNLYPKRDFLHVKDAVIAIELILRKTKKFNVYNVGSGKSYSIRQVCNILSKLYGKNISIKSINSESRKSEIANVVSDVTKIKKMGWKSHVDIHKGLGMTLEWYRKHYSKL
ncbi:MAG: GDP-mannose 4,6-dehydratase [Thaumarchaeota archaeon]|nr:GDP-mannose 4,6-dehydratase [Nitrososphaerota archaeon]